MSVLILIFIALAVFYLEFTPLDCLNFGYLVRIIFFVKLPFGSFMSSGGPTSTILPPSKTPKYCISEMYRDNDLTTAPHDSQNFSLASLTQFHHLLRSWLYLGALQLGSTSLGCRLPGSSAGCCEVKMRRGKKAKMSTSLVSGTAVKRSIKTEYIRRSWHIRLEQLKN